MPVHEDPVRVVLLCPDVQGVVSRDAVAIGARVVVEQLAHQRRRGLGVRVPGRCDDDVLDADELQLAVLRLVHHGLGALGIEFAVADQDAVDVVDAHRAALRAADAAEEEGSPRLKTG